ncbi:hypothetical protein [Streptomyces polyrhachis]
MGPSDGVGEGASEEGGGVVGGCDGDDVAVFCAVGAVAEVREGGGD